MIWKPTREWEGQDAFLIGGGPSLRGFNFSSLKGRKVIGCNDAHTLGPEIVTYNCFGDCSWFIRNTKNLEGNVIPFVTCSPQLLSFRFPNLFSMRRKMHGIATEEDTIAFNYSTGALAISLAFKLGAKRAFLLGYDLRNQNNQSHWHDKNPKIVRDFSFDRFVRGFLDLKKALESVEGFEVVNVNDGPSRLRDVFPTISLAEMFQMVKEEVAV